MQGMSIFVNTERLCKKCRNKRYNMVGRRLSCLFIIQSLKATDHVPSLCHLRPRRPSSSLRSCGRSPIGSRYSPFFYSWLFAPT
jgi:hypothetical protein